MKAIVIATKPDRTDWLNSCLKSFDGYNKYPIIVLTEYDFELGKIKFMYSNTTIDEFLFIQDSMIMKSTDWIDEVFNHNGSVSIGHTPFFMYLGKYTRETLSVVPMPDVNDKHDSVEQEFIWTEKYANADKNLKRILTDYTDTDIFIDINGRENMILENEYFIKYKGTWSKEMINKESEL